MTVTNERLTIATPHAPASPAVSALPEVAEERMAPAVRVVAGAVLLPLAVLTIVTMYIDHAAFPMPHEHLTLVPLGVAVMVGLWAAELWGMRWSHLLFAALVTLPNVGLVGMAHGQLNLLFQLLLAAWIGAAPRRGERIAGLVVALAPFLTGMGVEYIVEGHVLLSLWLSWLAITAAVWYLAHSLAGQHRLTAQLRQAQAILERQAEENAQLHQQAQQAAVLEERQRLARDMHDSATQSLYSARMYAEAALRLLERGDTETATGYVREGRDAIRDALAELRLLIYDLRPSILDEQGLAAALRLRLEAVEGRAGMAVAFHEDPDGAARLPAPMEQELYRLAQEALNNALKHARPAHIAVTLRQTPAAMTLTVADDGAGFDPAATDGAGLGLRSMQERAARLGGTLLVASAQSQGTTITIEVPR